MDIVLFWLSRFANWLAEAIVPFFAGMTPDDVTELFKQIILLAAIFFAVILFLNAAWRIIGLLVIRSRIKALASKNDPQAVKNHLAPELFFDANNRSKLADLSSRTSQFSEILEADNGILYATQDVETVSYTLWEPPLLRSRLIPAGAAILTGLGVLGTFAGLLLGLGGLQLDGNMEHLQAEIRQVAQGASVAFETSVWGVSLSLALTLLDKIFSSWVARSLLYLQKLLISLFPSFPLPEIMRDTCKASQAAANELASLSEQIGKKMQTSLKEFSATMHEQLTESLTEASNRISQAISASLTETLQTTLIPSIDRMSAASQDLATRQAQGSEEALSHLLTEFTGRMGEAGNSQKEAMREATQEMQQTMTTFADSMTGLVRSLQEQQQAFEQRQQDQMERLDAAFRKMSEEQGHNMGKASEDMLAVMASFRDGVREELSRQATDMGKISDDIHASLREMSASMKGFFEQMGELQQAQMGQLHSAFHQMNEAQGRNMDKASGDMLAVMDSFRNGMQQELSRQTGDMGKVSENIHGSLQEMSVTMKDFFEQLGLHQQKVSTAQDNRSKVLEKQMQQAFDQQSQALASMGNAITSHVSATKSLLKQGAELQRRIGEEDALLKNITTAMSSAGDSLQTASTRLQSFGEQIRSSIDRSAQSTERAVAVVQEVGKQENAVALELKNIITGMAPLRSGLEDVIRSLSSSVSTAREAYTQLSTHYEALQRALRDHMGSMQQQSRQYLAELGQQMRQQVEALDKQMGELLSDYAKLTKAQLDERMNAWNTQTRNFCDKMQSTAEAMAEVVDAMDSQPRR